MATAQQASTETLFHQWRKGDATSGQAMAQRFTDWFFAISATRLGETQGEEPFREACNAFSRGVGKVGDARRLLGWAHGIAKQQIHDRAPQGRVRDGDLPNAFTRKHPPKEILAKVREHLPAEMNLLETAYGGGDITDPLDILNARYRVKAFLRDQLQLPFRVAPTDPDPDRAPLTYYESGRMQGEAEETHFELYMLHDMEVCQDVAEFAHFAIALRGGIPGETPAARPAAAPPLPATTPRALAASPASTPAPNAPAAAQKASGDQRIAGVPAAVFYGAIGVSFGLVALLVVVAWMFGG